MKKLKDSQVTTKKFFEALAPLKDKIGPILFQLPPRWRCNPGRLETFMANLPHCFRYVFEFRDSSWFNTQVYSLLSKYKAAFCIYDLNKRLSPLEVTTDFAYIRLHGPNGPYEGKYDKNSLEWWSKNFKRWGKDKEIKRIYCYFDNDQVGFAVQNALELQDKINKRR
jgi:uncharacterized protein YecE (DUF72 family)